MNLSRSPIMTVPQPRTARSWRREAIYLRILLALALVSIFVLLGDQALDLAEARRLEINQIYSTQP